MNLYEVSDRYIEYLQQYDNKVLSNHLVKHNRKYIGIGIQFNNQLYYIPLSSPDDMDYFKDGKPRKTIIPIYRMFGNDGRLLGKLLLNNMIPVPKQELKEYSINDEADFKYRNLVLSELRVLEKPGVIDKIVKNAKTLYSQKNLNLDIGYLSATVDFRKLEKAKEQYNK